MARESVLDKALRELEETPPKSFTAARNALVKRLKEEGEDAAAKDVRKKKKPSASVWGINRLARTDEKAVRALLDAGAQLRLAQRKALSGAGASEMREALKALQSAVSVTARAVERVLRDAKEKPSAAVMERVRSTLLAAAEGDDTERAQLREGSLTEDLSAAGFGLVQPLKALSTPKKGHAPKEPSAQVQRAEEAERKRHRALHEKEVARLEKALESAERDASRLEKLAASAEERANSARRRADDAKAQARGAKLELERARKQLEG